jgi:hypothetical protein
MSRALVIVAVVLGMCAGQTLVGFAQTGPRTQPEPEFTQASQVVEGTISTVKGRWIVFSNGTQVAVPDNLIQQFEMKPGAVIRAMYEERGGQKFATSLELKDPKADAR